MFPSFAIFGDILSRFSEHNYWTKGIWEKRETADRSMCLQDIHTSVVNFFDRLK